MRRLGLAAGLVLILAGTVWVLQGLDVAFAPKSSMTGDGVWVAWGAAAILVGLAVLWASRRV
jgi:hypothetical protein